jgi:hypothetical protein
MMNVEQSVEWELVGETEVLRENLPQCHLDFLNDVWNLQEETVWLYITCFLYGKIIIIIIIIIIITIIMALQPFVEPWPLFQFLDAIHSR